MGVEELYALKAGVAATGRAGELSHPIEAITRVELFVFDLDQPSEELRSGQGDLRDLDVLVDLFLKNK